MDIQQQQHEEEKEEEQQQQMQIGCQGQIIYTILYNFFILVKLKKNCEL